MTEPSAVYRILWRAVKGRRQITFVSKRYYREAYPVILGYSADGEEMLFAYQVGGHTSPGNKLPGWRCFPVASIHELTSHKKDWYEADSHKQAQSCVQFTDVDANIPETLKRRAPLPFGSAHLRPPRGKS